jgi:hypothetical protein
MLNRYTTGAPVSPGGYEALSSCFALDKACIAFVHDFCSKLICLEEAFKGFSFSV